MIAEKLRQAILQAAIQGKLTKQLKSDGDASKLLTAIQVKRTEFIKKGKIKKETVLPKIAEAEKLFEIPNNWCWARFGEIVINRDAERRPVSKAERASLKKTYDYYGASGIIDKIDNYLFSEKLLLIGEDGANLINRSTPIAFIASGKYWVNNHAHVLQMYDGIDIDYLCLFVNAISLSAYVTGTAQPKMNQQRMNSIPVSIPPLAEQKRIVARIESLLPELDKLEKEETRLEMVQQAFPKAMKDSLLQAAIQGKLTKQLKSDDDAKDLLAKIQAEKEKLIKEGKIKKEKPLPEITEDEKPFEIPSNWVWVRHNSLFEIVGGSQPAKSYFKDKPEKGYVRLYQIRDYGETPVPVYVPMDMVSKFTKEGEILLARYGGSLGKVFRAKEGAYNVAMAKSAPLFITPFIDRNFMYYYYLAPLYQHLIKSSSRSAQAGFNKENLNDLFIPIPPLAEQKRIVKRLNELLPLCDEL